MIAMTSSKKAVLVVVGLSGMWFVLRVFKSRASGAIIQVCNTKTN